MINWSNTCGQGILFNQIIIMFLKNPNRNEQSSWRTTWDLLWWTTTSRNSWTPPASASTVTVRRSALTGPLMVFILYGNSEYDAYMVGNKQFDLFKAYIYTSTAILIFQKDLYTFTQHVIFALYKNKTFSLILNSIQRGYTVFYRVSLCCLKGGSEGVQRSKKAQDSPIIVSWPLRASLFCKAFAFFFLACFTNNIFFLC